MSAPTAADLNRRDLSVLGGRHAELRWENDEIHLLDVGSLNGTYVNREAVDSAVLVNGDEVQIGKFRLTFLTKPKNHGGAGGTHDSGSTDR